MSSIKRCDGCGSILEEGCAELFLDTKRKKPAKGKFRGDYDHYSADLCEACFKPIFSWLKGEIDLKKANGGVW